MIQNNQVSSVTDFPYRCALIIGAGPGISASLARRLSKFGLHIGLAARDAEKLRPLAEETAAAVSRLTSRSRTKRASSHCADLPRLQRESWARRGYTSPTSTSTEASAHSVGRTRAVSLTAHSTPMQSPKPTSISLRSRETPGRTKSIFGHGPSVSRISSATESFSQACPHASNATSIFQKRWAVEDREKASD